MRRTGRGFVLVVTTAFKADPLRATAVAILMVGSRAGFGLYAYWLKLGVDGVVRHDQHLLDLAGIGFAVSSILLFGSAWASFRLEIAVEEKTAMLLDRRLIMLMGDVPGLEHHERPDYLDELELLRQQRQALSGSVNAIMQNIGVFSQMATTALLLASVHPALLALPLFALPSLAMAAKAEQISQNAIEESTEGIRQSRHLYELATQSAPAKEVRLFGLAPELLRRHRSTWNSVDRVRTVARRRGTVLTSLGWLVFAGGYAGAVAFVVVRAVRGQATPGQVVLTMSLAAEVNNSVTMLAQMVAYFFITMKAVGRFLWLIDYAADARRPVRDPLPIPDRLESGIAFEGVGFAYPGSEAAVLEGVDLFLPAGSTVAIVGENGAGKTTLVKLLGRFYPPTSGRILVDGVDLTRLDIDAWRLRTSAGFQDFAKLEFLARRSVGVGALDELDDVEAVLAALDRASATDVADNLPEGLETQLGRNFDDGVELSLGQWQKVALGRAMMRDRPLLLLLDEPTASLDPQTEHALFERYAGAAARVARDNGAITVLVSHRFSTVRMADLILVVDGGRIVEAGSHTELVNARGLYAELYELQARAYR